MKSYRDGIKDNATGLSGRGEGAAAFQGGKGVNWRWGRVTEEGRQVKSRGSCWGAQCRINLRKEENKSLFDFKQVFVQL